MKNFQLNSYGKKKEVKPTINSYIESYSVFSYNIFIFNGGGMAVWHLK